MTDSLRNDGAAASSGPPPRAAPRRGRWRRRVLILGAVLLVLVALLALAPTILSLGAFKPSVERALAESLGAPVTLRGYRLGWLRGASLDGLEIAQPAGFPATEPLLRLEHAGLTLGWLALLRGDVDLAGEVRGARLLVYQRQDGSVNLEQLGGERSGAPGPHPERPRDLGDLLRRLQLDLAMRDIAIDVVHEQRGVLESVRNLQGSVAKRFGSADFAVRVGAELAGPGQGQPPGTLQLHADVDGSLERPIDVRLEAARLDFARYRPLADALLPPGALTELAGVLEGTLTARIANLDSVQAGGALTISGPRLAGALLRGMDVRAPRWVIEPKVLLTTGKAGSMPRADLAGFAVDLGFARLRGVPAAEAAAAFAGRDALALDFECDLQALGQFGGPLPAGLKEQPGALAGRVAVAVPAEGFENADKARLLADAVQGTARLELQALKLGAGTTLQGIALTATLAGGKAEARLAPGATVNGGPLTLAAGVDLRPEEWPATLTIGTSDAQLGAEAVHVLQYVVPLFAGLAGGAVQVDGKGTLSLQATGPAKAGAAETWLEWLNRWSGSGQLGLAQGSVVPAPAFAGLLQWLEPGQGGRLAFDAIGADFALRQGGVETGLLKLDRKATKLQITGRTTLDGRLDHTFDVRGLLAGHKDGEKVLAWLKDQPIGAKIAGTLTSPQLVLPDLQKIVADALRGAAEEEIRRQAEQAVRKGLEDLLRRRK